MSTTGLINSHCPDLKKTSPETSLMEVFTFYYLPVLMAEVISHYFPKLVELHNYISSSSANTKLANWNTLNSKIFVNTIRKSIKKTKLSNQQK